MSFCSFHTSERIVDYGREYDCVVLRKGSPCWEKYSTGPAISGLNGINTRKVAGLPGSLHTILQIPELNVYL